VTNTYIVELGDVDNSRTVSASYSVSASGTWEKKILTFPADTTGAFDNDNNVSLFVSFYLGAGSTFTSGTLATSWESTINANRAVGQVNLAAATNNYWQITGVQLELGDIATEFQFQNIQKELAACQRYYYRLNVSTVFGVVGNGFATTSSMAHFSIPFKSTMRTNPTLAEFSQLCCLDHTDATAITAISLQANIQNSEAANFNASVASGLTTFRPYSIAGNNNASGFIAFGAEL
jgi:phage gp37-like protein